MPFVEAIICMVVKSDIIQTLKCFHGFPTRFWIRSNWKIVSSTILIYLIWRKWLEYILSRYLRVWFRMVLCSFLHLIRKILQLTSFFNLNNIYNFWRFKNEYWEHQQNCCFPVFWIMFNNTKNATNVMRIYIN